MYFYNFLNFGMSPHLLKYVDRAKVSVEANLTLPVGYY
jgi:hypothetical protein